MSISTIKAIQIAKMVGHILHVPGNYRGGNLEMTIVIDSAMNMEQFKEDIKEIATALKRGNQIFRNVRLSLVQWNESGKYECKTIPFIFLQTGSCFADIKTERKSKYIDDLLLYLKKFHARSKVILLFTDDAYQIKDKQVSKEALSPFLKQKLLLLVNETPIMGTQVFMDCIK